MAALYSALNPSGVANWEDGASFAGVKQGLSPLPGGR